MKNLSLLNKLLYIINIVLVLLWFCAFLSPYISPQTFALGAILAIVYPILLLSHLFFILYWLIRFNKVIYLSTIVVLLSYFSSVPLFQTKSKFKALAKDNSFSVMSFNSQMFYYTGGKKEEVRLHQEKIAHFLSQESVDILCMQEARASLSTNLNYPYQSIKGFNQIYSQHKIIASGEILFDEISTNQSSFADILIHSDTVRVFNLHLESLHLGSKDYSLIKDWDEEVKEEGQLKNKTQRLSKKIKTASTKRVRQVEKVIESINNSPYPTLICGDFNDVPQSYIYRKLTQGHKDAFLESGKGFGATYRQLIFPFRIDYILTDEKWSSYNFTISNEKLSDHQAIRCDVELN